MQRFGKIPEHEALRAADLPRRKQGSMFGARSGRMLSAPNPVRRHREGWIPNRGYGRGHTHFVAMAPPRTWEAGFRAVGVRRTASSTTARKQTTGCTCLRFALEGGPSIPEAETHRIGQGRPPSRKICLRPSRIGPITKANATRSEISYDLERVLREAGGIEGGRGWHRLR